MLANPEDMKLLKRVRARGRGVRRLPGEMNGLEREYAAHLKLRQHAGEIEWWSFEGIKLRLADACFYCPDFMILLTGGEIEMHEVKGGKKHGYWCEDDAKVKVKVAADMFPFRFKIVWKYDGKWNEEVL